jgi:hypothetical protein
VAARAKVRDNNPHTLDELKTAIVQSTQSYAREDFIKVLRNRIKRVDACKEAKGGDLQHFF